MSKNKTAVDNHEEMQFVGFDIEVQKEAAKKEDEGSVVHIRGVDGNELYYPDGNGGRKPVTVTVAGVHSETYRRAEEKLRKRKLRAKKVTQELLYDDQIEKVAACVLAWDGFFSNGTPVELTSHNVKMILKACPWVLEDLTEAMNDHERFFSRG